MSAKSQKTSRLQPRGIRNNNPLNIRIGNTWLGEVSKPTDPDFEQFVSIDYGYRAACVLMRRYIKHYKRTTLAAIISAWAPASENNTIRYIDYVANSLNIGANDDIDYDDRETVCKMLYYMTIYECGCAADMYHIYRGYDLA